MKRKFDLLSDDTVQVELGNGRRFSVLLSKSGVDIIGDGLISITPRAANSVSVQFTQWSKSAKKHTRRLR